MKRVRSVKTRRAIYRSKTLVRALPKLGLCSRAQAFELIRLGRVMVNGKTVSDPNRITAGRDRIRVEGKDATQRKSRYIIFNKPAGCVTTRSDEHGRRTVYDILGDVGDWVFPVGRLDKDSQGLLIFTNDTKFGDFLTDPANKIARTYLVTVDTALSDEAIATALRGVDIGRGERSKPVSVKLVERSKRKTLMEIALIEGKNREIRRLCETLGATVTRLVRTKYGPFCLDGLASGQHRELDAVFCAALYAQKKR